jgi:hypothetical protein
MKKRLISVMLVIFVVSMFSFIYTTAPAVADEKAQHPRIAAAIQSLEGAIAELKAAPHNFGGHKAEAIAACQKAVNQLNKALAFREKEDAKKMK